MKKILIILLALSSCKKDDTTKPDPVTTTTSTATVTPTVTKPTEYYVEILPATYTHRVYINNVMVSRNEDSLKHMILVSGDILEITDKGMDGTDLNTMTTIQGRIEWRVNIDNRHAYSVNCYCDGRYKKVFE